MQPILKGVMAAALAGTVTAFATTSESVAPLATGNIHGDVELVSFGVATLSADRGPPIPTVHVREMLVNRNDDLVWTVDAAAATLWFGSGAPVHAVLANSDVATLPLLRLARGEHRVLDLYFPLAKQVTDDELRPFTVTYHVNTPDHRYEASVTLARSTQWPSREQRAPEPGWGRSWWANPAYPWAQYWHRPGHALPRPPKEIEIIQIPRAHFEVLPPIPGDVALDEWPRKDECDQW